MTYEEAMSNMDNIKIMNSVASRFCAQIPANILKQCKLLGLWKALKSHDFNQKRKFTTSLYKFVLWECQKEIRSRTQQKKKNDKFIIYAEQYQKTSKPEQFNLEMLQGLPEYEMGLLYDRFFLELTYKEIGKSRGISKQAAERHIKKVLLDLRNGVYGCMGMES